MTYVKKIVIKQKVCDRCGDEFEYQADNALEERDFTEAFPDLTCLTIHCPYCNYRNVLRPVKTAYLKSAGKS